MAGSSVEFKMQLEPFDGKLESFDGGRRKSKRGFLLKVVFEFGTVLRRVKGGRIWARIEGGRPLWGMSLRRALLVGLSLSDEYECHRYL